MDRQQVIQIEALNLTKLDPYIKWVSNVVNSTEKLWSQAVADTPVKDWSQLEKELEVIPFDAPVETKTALLMEFERIGIDLAPAFLIDNLKLTPEPDEMLRYVQMGALAKGTEKLFHKLHHYLHKDLKLTAATFPASFSNFAEMKGLMQRDYGCIRNLLWSMGKHDEKIGMGFGYILNLLDGQDPPAPVMAYVVKTHKLIKHDFFKWVQSLPQLLKTPAPQF